MTPETRDSIRAHVREHFASTTRPPVSEETAERLRRLLVPAVERVTERKIGAAA